MSASSSLTKVCKSIKREITIKYYNGGKQTQSITIPDAIITVSSFLDKTSDGSFPYIFYSDDALNSNTDFTKIEYAFSVPNSNSQFDCFIFNLNQTINDGNKNVFEKHFGKSHQERKQIIEISQEPKPDTKTDEGLIEDKIIRVFLEKSISLRSNRH